MQQAYIVDCIFENLNLTDVDFYASILCSSTFQNARLGGVIFTKQI